jgi:hypothetical protein
MSRYQQVLDIARQQSAALAQGELDVATALLDPRAALLYGAPAPTVAEGPLVTEILRLDRSLSSAIREAMIAIRNEALEGHKGRQALGGYGRPLPPSPAALDRLS